MENSLEKKQRVNLLMDLYEDLLTEKQREYLDLYEEKLNLLEKHQKRLEIIDDLEKDIKEEHKNIDEHLQMLRDL